MAEAENVEIVRGMYDAFERGDLAAIVDLLDEDIDFEFQGPQEIPYTGVFRWRENVKKFFESVGEHVDGEARRDPRPADLEPAQAVVARPQVQPEGPFAQTARCLVVVEGHAVGVVLDEGTGVLREAAGAHPS